MRYEPKVYGSFVPEESRFVALKTSERERAEESSSNTTLPFNGR